MIRVQRFHFSNRRKSKISIKSVNHFRYSLSYTNRAEERKKRPARKRRDENGRNENEKARVCACVCECVREENRNERGEQEASGNKK